MGVARFSPLQHAAQIPPLAVNPLHNGHSGGQISAITEWVSFWIVVMMVPVASITEPSTAVLNFPLTGMILHQRGLVFCPGFAMLGA